MCTLIERPPGPTASAECTQKGACARTHNHTFIALRWRAATHPHRHGITDHAYSSSYPAAGQQRVPEAPIKSKMRNGGPWYALVVMVCRRRLARAHITHSHIELRFTRCTGCHPHRRLLHPSPSILVKATGSLREYMAHDCAKRTYAYSERWSNRNRAS